MGRVGKSKESTMHNRVFYIIGIAFTSGIFLSSFFDSGVSGVLLISTVGLACVIAGKIQGMEKSRALFLVGLFCIFGSLGMARLEYAERNVSPYTALEGEKVVLEARIVVEPSERETTTQLYIVPTDASVGTERILVTADRFLIENQNIRYGDTVRIEGILKKPKAFMTDTGREFDYAGFLRTKGVVYMIGFAEVTIVEHRETVLGKLFIGKESFLNALQDAVPEPAAGLGAGMLLGVKRALGEHLDTVFRETGIIHIVVLSGYNIMIVVEVLMSILAFFFLPRMRMMLGILGIVAFALLVGLSATVLRASIMAILLLVARGTGRMYAVLRALVLAGVAMLVANPYLLVHDPGFQLSFLATLGLIIFSPLIEPKLTYVPERYGVRALAAATLAVQIIVLPLLLFHTGMISLIALVTNILVLPMVPYAMLLTFFTGIVSMLSHTLGMGVGFVTYLSLEYIITIAEWCARVPFASVSISMFPFWGMVIAYVGIGFFYMRSAHKEDIENEYDGWVIEEEIEKEKSPEALRASGNSSTTFPFR